MLDTGQAVPEPMAEQAYSGKLLLRLSRSLHRRAAEVAHAEGVSLNQFVVTTLAERVGGIETKATSKTTVVLASPFVAGGGIPLTMYSTVQASDPTVLIVPSAETVSTGPTVN